VQLVTRQYEYIGWPAGLYSVSDCLQQNVLLEDLQRPRNAHIKSAPWSEWSGTGCTFVRV